MLALWYFWLGYKEYQRIFFRHFGKEYDAAVTSVLRNYYKLGGYVGIEPPEGWESQAAARKEREEAGAKPAPIAQSSEAPSATQLTPHPPEETSTIDEPSVTTGSPAALPADTTEPPVTATDATEAEDVPPEEKEES